MNFLFVRCAIPKMFACSHADSDQTEYDYHYGEEREDSDTESGGNNRTANAK